MSRSNPPGTLVGQRLNGQYWDGVAWITEVENFDNAISFPEAAGALSDAQRAQLIAQRNVPASSFTAGGRPVLSYVEGSVTAYRTILATGASAYSLVRPT